MLDLDGAGRPLAAAVAEIRSAKEGVPGAAFGRVSSVLAGIYEAHSAGSHGSASRSLLQAHRRPRRTSSFDGTFNRWRTLFDAAERQVEEAHGG